MKVWWCCVLTLAFCSTSFGIQILLNDAVTSRTQFCVGESLTLVCTGNTVTYQWRVENIIAENVLQVTPGFNTSTVMNFTATYISMTETRLQFVIPAMFDNNTLFTCFDVVNNVEVSTATLQLRGDPSAPVVQDSLWDATMMSYPLTIGPPVSNSPCVTQYCVNITEVSSSGSQVFSSVFSVDDPTMSLGVSINETIVPSLDPCNSNYSFSVWACNSNESVTVIGINNFNGTFNSPVLNVTYSSVSFNLLVNFDHCANVSGYIQLNDQSNQVKCFNVGEITSFFFDQLMPMTMYNLEIMVELPSGQILNVGSITFATVSTTEDPAPVGGLGIGAIVGIAIVGVAGLIALGLIIIVICYFCFCRGRKPEPLKNEMSARNEQPVESYPEDNIPTYQAPDSIKREAAGPTGDMYTVPTNIKKSSKKAKPKPETELPMYSVVDKTKKNDENAGLVYADIDVKNPVAPRSRPPPPPGVTELDPNEPVLYSTVN